jgi:threonine aldolase
VQANAVFVSLPGGAIDPLRAALPGELPFYVWDEKRGVVRLMCSWDTTEEDVDGLAAAVAGAVKDA